MTVLICNFVTVNLLDTTATDTLKQHRRRRIGKFSVSREAVHGGEDEGVGGPDYSGDDGRLRGRRLRRRGRRRHPTQFKRLEEDVGLWAAWVDARGGRDRIVTGKTHYLAVHIFL